MSQDNIKSFAREAFKTSLSKLAAAKAIEDAIFADVIYTAVSQFGVHEDTFRDTFGLTKGAVDRWTQQQNLPQPQIRSKILLWLKEQI